MTANSFIRGPIHRVTGEESTAINRPSSDWSCGIFLFFVTFLLSAPISLAQDGAKLGPTPGVSADQIQDGWLSLFDGKTLFGWSAVTKADWKVENGEIRVSQGERGLLRTTSQFDDFEMTIEFKAAEQTNSGIFLRTSPEPKNVLRDCYELNIADPRGHDFPTGSVVERAKCNLDVTPNQWHHFRILADGAKIKVWLDDEKACEFIDPDPIGRGYIGLQLNSGAVAFRNISIKPINGKQLLAGTNLNHWKTDQALESRFQMTDQGELRILGGRGQIESRDLFGDMTLSLLCKTNQVGLNSGVFFRCIPGELMNGYESQIQNEFNNGDRGQPVDCGTGGIFRRVDARRVNANDREWFAKTIIATGPHISVWVNGYHVTDWTDKRAPDPNPRRGRRLKKGTIIFQGHDPTTDILIKNVIAREITARHPRENN